MKLHYLAITALVIAVTAPFAAIAAPGSGASMLEERAASMPLVDQAAHAAADVAGVPVDGRSGKLEASAAGISPVPSSSMPLKVERLVQASVDRESIAPHLRL